VGFCVQLFGLSPGPDLVRDACPNAASALAAGSQQLACACDDPQCPDAVDDDRASNVVVHVIAKQSSTQPPPDPQLHGEALAPDDARYRPAQSPIARKLPSDDARPDEGPYTAKPIATPGTAAEPRCRPSTALDEFVRLRELTCSAPGCDKPAIFGDIDHTVPSPGGSTHRWTQVLPPKIPRNPAAPCRSLRTRNRGYKRISPTVRPTISLAVDLRCRGDRPDTRS